MEAACALLDSGRGHQGPLQDRGKAENAGAQTEVRTLLSCPERKAQETLYYGDAADNPHTVNLRSCRLQFTRQGCDPRTSGKARSAPFLQRVWSGIC